MLKAHDVQLLRMGMLAERYFSDDPNTCLMKLRQLAEVLAQATATRVGLYLRPEETQYDLLARLRDQGIIPPQIHQLFGEIRRSGNAANHALAGDHRVALAVLKIAWQVSVWFHRAFKDPAYQSGPFIPPRPPKDESEELRQELATLAKALAGHQAEQQEKAQQLASLAAELAAAKSEQAFWEHMAAEVEAEKKALQERLAAQQQANLGQSAKATAALVKAAASAALNVQLDEAETRRLIDAQLVQAGWTADSINLRHSKGARPQKGKFLAIAEWPTAHGPADYVLFAGLLPVAAIEAKRKNINVSSTLQQAKRYSRGFEPCGDIELNDENWGDNGEFRLPFVFSTNGRPYLRQLETHSGIWFCDLRRTDNLSHALQGWPSPEGLIALLKQDAAAADKQLESEPFNFGFPIRDYQEAAILQTEKEIAKGRREILLAMATGTGKTKTCIALIYRLLKTKRFRRILFLVDRSALGVQAADAFKDTRMENLNTFAETFGIKELEDQKPDSDTAVHIATVQGMVQRVLFPAEGSPPPTVDEYDCIIVDECHRGYLLDREMSETEQTFRSYEDYVSKYRRILDYFSAVKVGLTATPALHTTEIFGPPAFTYTYREAVIDGHLIDHDPPVKIKTELSVTGIVWKKGEEVKVYEAATSTIDLALAPDEIKIEVDQFNRKVITEPFNRVICNYLATEIDPNSARKTLIFCANDAHADLVVDLLKKAFQETYGSVDDDAVIKITGTADKPLRLIRRYKNERLPNVAVTVDLLTTGIDVPAICHLVFLRRVNSRILFDQMLGRATRRCDDIDKETFRIFDAVGIYDALQGMTAMRPVVNDPAISFTQLARELTEVSTDEAIALVRDQFVAKLQRKKRHLGETAARDFETVAGSPPNAFIESLRRLPLAEVAAWFIANPGLGEILDRKREGPADPIFVSDHEDRLWEVAQGFGDKEKPEDYLEAFKEFINTQGNKIPALVTVVTRPQELTRKQLRELRYELDKAGFNEVSLDAAWHRTTNHDVAASIIGYIRQAALGDPLVPFAERVDAAHKAMLASRSWTQPQREWLKRLAAQTKANRIVDRAAIDDPHLIFKCEGGGFKRLDKIFEGRLDQVLHHFNDSVWSKAQ